MPSPSAVVAVDLGKSRCRAVVSESDAVAGRRSARRPLHEGVGAPGLTATGGVAAALESILPLRARLDVPISSISVGAAGAWTAPTAASELARRLADTFGVPAIVTSDVVSAHAGALGGGAGVLLIAGTGAAALGVDGSLNDGDDDSDDGGGGTGGGRAVLVDGWGPELGDFGSGSWLGREALRAVLRASVGLGPSTRLTDAVAIPIGAPSAIHAWLADDGPLPRRLATLAPLVLDAAESGDDVAGDIAAEGIRLLAASATAASARGGSSSNGASASGGDAVALHGGLTEHVWFRAALEAAMRAAGHAVVVSAGDALDGALLLADRADLPHERFVHRAE
ncbi:N-acetylglucosamine kinase-like BadF-type ATPase [Microbacterium foliorum]|uniref:BadF/BadG/BcrA/BcrD ATPase family protein n=1 Tax=Microbacterium foliorum TaxID=104336 RepID=UPI0020A15E6C|nr:BadF/BadG/BcrA/BcrD ATPase family protein [Microbacterium foliorum]MCP1429305.1 N-acetylglucosamine kinase-like BadF-type ATPase [Microbacterium foliorum]